MKSIDIHGKPYVMVKDRVIHFNNEYPNGCIQSKKVDSSDDIVIFEATVIPDVDKPERFFNGHAEEKIGSSQINMTSALENCETSAIGRALAMMGIGVDESFASGDEVANAAYQQSQGITKAHAKEAVESQNTPKTAENGLKCPVCGGGVWDNRIKDKDGEWCIDAQKHPTFKCKDKTCAFPATWETDSEIALHSPKKEDDGESKRQEDKEPVVEEELPF